MRVKGTAAALTTGLLGLASCAGSPPRAPKASIAATHQHVGPVTGVVSLGDDFAACSQAGLAWGIEKVCAPTPFRPFALAALTSDSVLIAGGAPGRSGEVAVLGREGTRAERQLGDDLLYAVAVAADARRVAAAGAAGRVHLLDLPGLDHAQVFADHTAACRAVAFAPDGTYWASAGLDGIVVLRNLGAERAQRLVDHTGPVECLTIRADSARLASGARDGKVRVHARDGRLLRTFGRLGAEVLALAWRDGTTLLAGLSDGRVLALEDDGDGARIELAHLDGPVFALAVSGDRLALGTVGSVRLLPRR